MSDVNPASPSFQFTFHPSVSPFSVPAQTYLKDHPNHKLGASYGFIAGGAFVLDDSSPPRVLLIQRAPRDSMPNRWEVPGGGVDDEDPTVLHGVARELWEEAGLIAVHVGSQIGDGHIFLTKSGKVVCKFNFLVDAKKDTNGETPVKLDPDEHQNYVWATEEEVKAHKCGDFELLFTTRAQEALVLHAFELRRKIGQEKADSGA